MDKLTKRQSDVLKAIKKYIAAKGYTPTVRDVGAALDLRSPATIHFHITKLEEKGYIRKDKAKNRALELLVPNEYANKDSNVASIALLGQITAGNPIEAIETPDEYIDLPTNIIPTKKEVFALHIQGTSMINKGIHDNDIVVIERRNTANNGDIVAAMTGENEVTLKTFYKEKDHFRLQPENDTMAPILLDTVTILGIAVGLYRKF